MPYERSDAPQTRFERREGISRFLGDIEEHLGGIDNPLPLRCEELVGLIITIIVGFVHGPGSIPVPLVSGCRFPDIVDVSLERSGGSSSSSLCPDHEDVAWSNV